MDKKSGEPEKTDALRLYQEEILEAARALDSILGGHPPDYALRLLRDAACAERAWEDYFAAQIVQAQPGDDEWVGQLRPMVMADTFHIASDFIEATPADVNPFLASIVRTALMWSHAPKGVGNVGNVEGWRGKLKSVLSEWVSWDAKRPPSCLPVLFSMALEHGYTAEQIAKGRGCSTQAIRSAISEGRRRRGLSPLRKKKRRST